MTDAATAVDAAMDQFKDMLAADGYSLTWSVTPADKVVVQIVAGPQACEDCLVPLPIMEAIVADALEPTPCTLDHIVLPAGASH